MCETSRRFQVTSDSANVTHCPLIDGCESLKPVALHSYAIPGRHLSFSGLKPRYASLECRRNASARRKTYRCLLGSTRRPKPAVPRRWPRRKRRRRGYYTAWPNLRQSLRAISPPALNAAGYHFCLVDSAYRGGYRNFDDRFTDRAAGAAGGRRLSASLNLYP